MEYSKKKRLEVFNMAKGKCFYCGCELEFETFNIDHVIPKINGGKSTGNLVPTCKLCNFSKGSSSLEEFRTRLEQMPNRNSTSKLLCKYYGVKPKKIKFYFEKEGIKIT